MKNWKHQLNIDFSHLRGGDLNELTCFIEELLGLQEDKNYEEWKKDMKECADEAIKASVEAYKEGKEDTKKKLKEQLDTLPRYMTNDQAIEDRGEFIKAEAVFDILNKLKNV